MVRHGETDKNIGNKLHEKGDDETLNEKGRKQIEKTGIILKKQNIELVFYSKELRTKDNATLLAGIIGCPAAETDGFEERNW